MAAILSQNLTLPLLHLDQIAHRPDSNWERVPDIDLVVAQDAFLEIHNEWVIEGNYSVCMAKRLELATTVIWCDPPLTGCIIRYLIRCFKPARHRIGGLEKSHKEFNLGLIQYTLQSYPKSRKKYQKMINGFAHLEVIHLKSFAQIKKFGKTAKFSNQ